MISKAERDKLDLEFALALQNLPATVRTPVGSELVDVSWCEEPTRIYSQGELEDLLREAAPKSEHSTPTLPEIPGLVLPPVRRNSRPKLDIDMVNKAFSSGGRKEET